MLASAFAEAQRALKTAVKSRVDTDRSRGQSSANRYIVYPTAANRT